ncbi:MAG TPA: FimV/HubP family polar landmark protein, partial [Burkholderiaceae bacterium]|nr:FimV/HubP family polar landmark protein [Burkholderiaceae bacterium]
MSFALKTLSAAVISALLLSNATAAGLGKMTVLSALGQPLRAEIELTSVTDDEIGQLNPKLASVDAFRQANVEYIPALRALHFAVESRGGGRQVISVTSVQAINDPFVDLLLELGGNGTSRLVREYTFLLDPPSDLRNDQAPEASVARPSTALRTSPTQNQAQSQNAVPTPTRAADESSRSDRPSQVARMPRGAQERPTKPVTSAPTPTPAQKTAQQGDVQVKSGDTLSKIAGQVKPDGISLDQMLVALYRANTSAFVGNNMNRLRAGQVLTVPDASSVGETSNAQAHSVVVAQTADFNEYRNKLAGQVANSDAQKSTEARQSASGKVTAKVEEKPTAATEAKDKLKLSKAGVPTEKGGKNAAEEDKVAKEKAIAEANSRVKQLEKNVSDLQKVLEVKNKNLADQQKADAA